MIDVIFLKPQELGHGCSKAVTSLLLAAQSLPSAFREGAAFRAMNELETATCKGNFAADLPADAANGNNRYNP